MQVRRVVIVVLAFAGLVAAADLLGRSGWAWALVAGGAFAYGHARTGSHELLAVGGALVGVSVGLVFGAWGWPGAFPLSVGAGLVTADWLAPRTGSWTLPLGATLLLAGLAIGVFASRATAATALALALVALGVLLTARGRQAPPPKPAALPAPPRRRDDDPAPAAAER